MRKTIKQAEYQKNYRRQVEIKKKWGGCEMCGGAEALIILTGKDKAGLSPKEIRETGVLCARCLLRDQPLLIPRTSHGDPQCKVSRGPSSSLPQLPK